jgi:transposase
VGRKGFGASSAKRHPVWEVTELEASSGLNVVKKPFQGWGALAVKRRKRKIGQEIPKLADLEQINFNAAGLDVGDEEIYVAVPEGRDEVSVRVFRTFTVDLYALADWLESCGVDTVAMESTGVYWIPIYDILERRGFEVYLVNARHIKNVSGRKTDILDCQWIRQLHTYGLLQASFRPAEEIRALRGLVRHRENLIKSTTREIQHMQKALQQMNLKLSNVISDLTGVTGMLIIRDIVVGEQDPKKLAQHRNVRCAKSEVEIAKSLQGHYKPEHVFELKQALAAYDFYQRQIKECDTEIERRYTDLEPRNEGDDRPLPPPKRKRSKTSKNAPDFDLRQHLFRWAGVDLTQIDGPDVLTIQKVLTEIGVDMTPWPTVKHFTSWLGLCPNNDKTGGKVIKRSTKKTQNRAAAALRMAAQSLVHSKSALGAYHRRMRAKLGKPEAVTASAHKLARIIYTMLKNQTEYVAPGQDYYEERSRQRALQRLKRSAKDLGFELIAVAS